MTALKLLAFDDEDLQVVSAHLQDALLQCGDMKWQPSARRFVAIVNRFDWEQALAADDAKGDGRLFERRCCILRVEKVDAVKARNLRPGSEEVLELLAIVYTPLEAPAAYIELVFADDRSIRLEVECIEAEVTDVGDSWHTRRKPAHQ